MIVTSRRRRNLIRNFAVPAEKDHHRRTGHGSRAARAWQHDGAPILVAVGSIVPRKGYDVLVEALASIAQMQWRCTIVGSPERATDFVQNVRARIAAHGLESRIKLAGTTAKRLSVCRTCVAADRNMKEVEHETRPDS